MSSIDGLPLVFVGYRFQSPLVEECGDGGLVNWLVNLGRVDSILNSSYSPPVAHRI